MAERNNRNERAPDRRASEGVRIIGAEEAQKALDAGQAAGRRGDDQLRYGDVPPAPSGPRPPHRFPLPGSIDPSAAGPRPLVAPVKGDPSLPRANRPVAVAPGAPGGDTGQVEAKGTHPVGEAQDTPASGPDAARAEASGPAAPPSPAGEAGPDSGAEGAPADAPSDRGVAGIDPPPYEPPAYRPAAYEPPRRPPGASGPVAGAKTTTWPAAVEGLAAGAGHPVGAAGGRVPGSGPSDPYAWPDMPDQPQDEPPTTANPWTPPAEDPSQGWRLGDRPEDDDDPSPDDAAVPDLAPPEDGITLTGSHQLPHWSEPASGEVPAALADPGREDDYDGWDNSGSHQARWRSEHDDWDDASDVHYLAGDEEPGGALDSDLGERSDLYSFDEDFERLEEERSGTHQAVPFDVAAEAPDPPPVAIGTRASRRRTPSPGIAPTGRRMSGQSARRVATGETSNRVVVGAGMLIVLAIAYIVGPKALLVLAAAVVVASAVETYGILQRSGFRPATLLGLVASGGLVFAGYWRGVGALPLVLALTFAATMVWYLLGIVEARPLANVAVTAMTVLWIGFFGAFSALLLRVHDGKGLFIGAVAVVVVSDIVAYLVGSQMGRHPLAPDISPGKTVEGLVAGIVGAIVAGLVVGEWIAVWGGVKHGLALGVMVAVLGPIGDLFESLIKRDLNVKDSGTILGGHGGLLDRFDSLLIVLPGAYFLASYLNLLK